MGRFFGRGDEVEQQLRARRTDAPGELVDQLVVRVAGPRRNLRSVRLIAATGFTTVALTGATALGGVGYAVAGVHTVTNAVSHSTFNGGSYGNNGYGGYGGQGGSSPAKNCYCRYGDCHHQPPPPPPHKPCPGKPWGGNFGHSY